jgi:hypothetical protein
VGRIQKVFKIVILRDFSLIEYLYFFFRMPILTAEIACFSIN